MRQVASEVSHQRIGVRLAANELAAATSLRDARERLAKLAENLEREGADLRGTIDRSEAEIVRNQIERLGGGTAYVPTRGTHGQHDDA